MMKKAKRFLAMTAALMLCFGLVNLPEINVKAAETLEAEAQEEYPGDVIGTATINLTQTYAIGENGNIKGDGARLRKRPKKTATVLELMYNGEHVCINYTKSASESNGDWYYVKRVKTGTDRKSTRLNSSHNRESRMPSSA